jgi:uncharacterized membrane protein YtjA (UPF0391 family)
MLGMVLMFLDVSIIAALFGFNGLEAGAASFAKVFSFSFLVVLGISVVAWLTTVDGGDHG